MLRRCIKHKRERGERSKIGRHSLNRTDSRINREKPHWHKRASEKNKLFTYRFNKIIWFSGFLRRLPLFAIIVSASSISLTAAAVKFLYILLFLSLYLSRTFPFSLSLSVLFYLLVSASTSRTMAVLDAKRRKRERANGEWNNTQKSLFYAWKLQFLCLQNVKFASSVISYYGTFPCCCCFHSFYTIMARGERKVFFLILAVRLRRHGEWARASGEYTRRRKGGRGGGEYSKNAKCYVREIIFEWDDESEREIEIAI